jgi:ribonuclease HI
MSTSRDPSRVLHYLAKCLDVQKTLDAFPEMTKEELKKIVQRAAGSLEKTESPALLWVDGAARGNPGPAGAGFVLEKGGNRILGAGQYLGETTNNEAEYRALILGIEAASLHDCDDLEVRSDSELMVRQMKGEYRVKSHHLQEFYFQVVKKMKLFRRVVFTHVRRQENKEADRLANMAIDAKGPVELSHR